MQNATGTGLRAGALLFLVGALGFVAGIGTERAVLADRATSSATPEARDPGALTIIRGDDPEGTMGRQVIRLGLPQELAAELDLSDEQRGEIERILAEDQAALRSALEEVQPTLYEIVERSRRRIEGVLTEEQFQRWEQSSTLRLRGRDGPSDRP